MTLEFSRSFDLNINNSVIEYDRAETEALSKFGNTVIQAFKPSLFEAQGYPSRILSDKELWRYHDMMKDGQFGNLLHALKTLSASEFEMVKDVSELIREFGVKFLGVSGTGKKALLASLNYLRILESRIGEDNLEGLKILEIGPGCGYLALLAWQKGYFYCGVENSQAIYLYQKNLWRSIAGDLYTELSDNEISAVPNLVHIPWWIAADLTKKLPDFDVVICNHALQEMNDSALSFYLRRIRDEWIHRSFDNGLFVSQGLGAKNSKDVFATFKRCGFELVENSEYGNKHEYVYCWKLEGSIGREIFNKVRDVTFKRLLIQLLIKCRRGKIREALSLFKKIIIVKSRNLRDLKLEFPSSVLSSWATQRTIDIDLLRDHFERVIPEEMTAEDKFRNYLKFGLKL